MEVDERTLIEQAKKGDARAIEALLTRHERQVYRFGLRMCGSEDAAREVLQQTLLTAFRGIKDFRQDSQLSTWLYQIARSFCIKSRRRRVDEPDSMEPLDSPAALSQAASGADPEARAQAQQVGAALQAAISALSTTHREVLVLRDVEGLSAEEASTVLGIEVPALKSRLHRARMELRRHLSALLESQDGGAECPELADELAEYAAQEIDQATCIRIEDHLSRCERCARACDALKHSVSLCRSIPGGEVPLPVQSAVRHALRNAIAGS
jgi:RNA polymerase sigma-70 factor, ECF subfamily